ncbi:hypothetical protein EV677_2406 [Herminiimonas fonticola]|uniref:Uncharacterized protein n=1 Tax=Herminiimonas fonticola TaxID=303380 RepID=A0A4R6G6Y8_9BURK|nr:hypothetical protein Hfont_2141 [Herminiimonas fonticola]TDN90329.1 hypothetical protein EV677_2406 [Herminiimonas fonticola]
MRRCRSSSTNACSIAERPFAPACISWGNILFRSRIQPVDEKKEKEMRFAQIGSAACLYISVLLISGCATPYLKPTSEQASSASQEPTFCLQSNDMSCSITADPAVQPEPRKNCHQLPEGFDPEKDSGACPIENVWGTGRRGGYQCCKRPPV